MQWSDLVGHHRQRQWFQNAVAKQRLGNTFLLVGPDGIGKRAFARLVAKSLLCHSAQAQKLVPCGECESCAQVDARTHPDLLEIKKPEDKSALSIDLFAGEREVRGQEGLIRDIHLKSYHGRGKVAIIDDADYFNEESANCMLKTLEEPPPGARIFLIGTSLQRQLPTIRSRSQIVRFQGLSHDELSTLASRLGLPELTTAQTQSLREGSLTAWKERTDPEIDIFKTQLYERLTARPMDFVGLAKAITSSLDSVAKEGAKRRNHLRLILMMVIDFYREAWAFSASGTDSSRLVAPRVREVVQSWGGSQGPATKAIQRSLEAIHEVDRNLVAANVLEAWASDLATICQA